VLSSQQKAPPRPATAGQEQSGTVFRTDTRLVILHATVVDKNGHLVTNLAKEAFQVYENDVQQQVKVFKQEDVPISMGLVIDNSGSMRDKRARVESAGLTLVKLSNPQDEVFIVNFNDDAFLDKEFTSDIKELEEGLTRIDARGGTAMRDALRMSIDHLNEKAKKDKRVLVVVSDGNDNSSMITLENLVKAAQQSEVVLYMVGLLNDEERREAKRAKRALGALAEATGGQAYFPEEAGDVEKIARQVARDIRNQYTIGYTPVNQDLDGSFRKVRVTANAPSKPTVRTRSGYYANKNAGSAVSRNSSGL
jgi:VWFA-related protein